MATDWTLEIAKLVLTPLLAGGGAYIGFLLSNRSKKHDLLYKEKMEAFKSLSAELLTLRRAAYVVLLGDYNVDHPKVVKVEQALETLNEFLHRLHYSPEEFMLFLDSRTRKSFMRLQAALSSYVVAGIRIGGESTTPRGWLSTVNARAGKLESQELRRLRTYGESLENVGLAAEEVVNALYADIGLPSLTPIFAAERAGFTTSLLTKGIAVPALQYAIERSTGTMISYEDFERATLEGLPPEQFEKPFGPIKPRRSWWPIRVIRRRRSS